ncbi:VPS9 domain protein [Pseudohyphozyma bogoriensis]|nr:VPS9 domain protein [Pseudohyphozyma bogoriensis]
MSTSGTSSPLSSSPTNSIHSTLSLGRSSGKRSLRTAPSTDTLSAHPLLATTSSSTPVEGPLSLAGISANGGGAASSSSGGAGGAQYSVYKSKRNSLQGQTPAPSTTLAPPSPAEPIPSSPSPSPTSPKPSTNAPPLISRPSNSTLPSTLPRNPPSRSISEATAKLLTQRIKADVQGLGLGNESVGAGLVNKLGGMGKEGEWSAVFGAVASGKVTLLLPAERLPSATLLTPAFFMDHMVIFEQPITSPSADGRWRGFATLSGLRGVMDSQSLVFVSPGNALVESQAGILKPGMLANPDYASEKLQRSLTGSTFPTPPTPSFPSTLLISTISELSIPRTSNTSSNKDSIGRSMGSTAGSRLAALFAKAPTPTNEADLPPVVPAPPGLLSSDPSTSTLPSTDDDGPSLFSSGSSSPTTKSSVPNLDISVLAIAKRVNHAEIVKLIGKSLDAHLRESLRLVDGCEGDASILERVCGFAAKFQPPPGWSSSLAPPGAGTSGKGASVGVGSESYWIGGKGIEDVSDDFQDMLHAIRLDLTRNIRASTGRERDEEEDMTALEERVDASLEVVEKILAESLWDRVFCPASTGDEQADENLRERIRALTALELSMEHLGLDLGGLDGDEWGEERVSSEGVNVRESLEEIIASAGKELARLQDSSVRSPRAQLDIFVNVHKIIVEGLSGLPPIPLKEPTEPGPKPNEEVEMDDASSLNPSRPTSRPASVHSKAEVVDESPTFRTPRPTLERGPGSVPEIRLPKPLSASDLKSHSSSSSSLTGELASSVQDATQSSVFDSAPRRDSSPSSSSSADLILPLLIYLVVQANPTRLPSTLNFIQRFRTESLMRGESAYCCTNIQATIEFLTEVDISTLGLSTQNLMNLGPYSPTPGSAPKGVGGKLKGRVTNVTVELDHFVDSANTALVNVVDSSYRILFGPKGFAPKTIEDVKNVLDGAGSVASKARGSLLRRATTPANFQPVESGEASPVGSGAGAQREMVDFLLGTGEGSVEKPEDAKSIKSVPEFRRDREKSVSGDERLSISERLAGVVRSSSSKSVNAETGATASKSSIFSALSTSPIARRATINATSPLNQSTPPPLPSTTSPFFANYSKDVLVQPVERFMSCEVGDLRMGEVGELLAEYKKLARELERVRSGAAAP